MAGDRKAVGMAGGAVGWGPSRKGVAERRPACLMGEHSPIGTVPVFSQGHLHLFPQHLQEKMLVRDE